MAPLGLPDKSSWACFATAPCTALARTQHLVQGNRGAEHSFVLPVLAAHGCSGRVCCPEGLQAWWVAANIAQTMAQASQTQTATGATACGRLPLNAIDCPLAGAAINRAWSMVGAVAYHTGVAGVVGQGWSQCGLLDSYKALVLKSAQPNPLTH